MSGDVQEVPVNTMQLDDSAASDHACFADSTGAFA
jgi:hypothetical protein